ncbi:23210_t:CDS:2 [Rhizophagus irregularis]|nr:23210_t:CDS:2 [Rhizophagus irregularis]
MNIDNLLRDRYNNNSYNLYQRNVLARLNKKGCGSKSKKMWKEESEEIKKFFKILAIEGNRRFKLRNPKSPSTQPPPQPPKKKLPLLLPRPPLTQPYVYYQPHSYEYYQPQPLSSPVEYWKMHKLSDESQYQPQQLPIHCVSALLHEDNQSLDDSWFPDEFHLPISQPLPELLLNNEHEQPQSPLAFDVYFNDLD